MRKQEDLLRTKEVLPLLERLYQELDLYSDIMRADSREYKVLYEKGIRDPQVSIADCDWYQFNYEIGVNNADESSKICDYIEYIARYLKENGQFVNTALHKYENK